MAFIALRCARRVRSSALCTAFNLNVVQSAGITSPGGKPRDRPYKQYDYRKKMFTHLNQPFDRTLRRMDENSKVIVIDGPIASGKTEFAKKLAHELDFKFVPQPNVKDMYRAGTEGLTYQDLDDLLPSNYRLYDLESFYMDSTPKLADGQCRAGELQFDFFASRLFAYNDALLHLLSTGLCFIPKYSTYIVSVCL